MALSVDAHRGLVLLAAVPYDDAIIDWVRALPERHYRPHVHAWCVPARREQLRHLSTLIGELEERDIGVDISKSATARLVRADVGRAILRDKAIDITAPYNPRLVRALRALPERRFHPTRRTWTVPLTRAGSLAILDLIDHTNELVATRRARLALQRSATRTSSTPRANREPDPTAIGPTRRSPIAHWRHYTRGPIFENPARERMHVPGIGLCVRVRVNPAPSRQSPASGRPTTPSARLEVQRG
jgi:hypothetical protein